MVDVKIGDIQKLSNIINEDFYINITDDKNNITSLIRYQAINKFKFIRESFTSINNVNLRTIRGVKTSYLYFIKLSDGYFNVQLVLDDNLKTNNKIIYSDDILSFILRKERLEIINKLINNEKES